MGNVCGKKEDGEEVIEAPVKTPNPMVPDHTVDGLAVMRTVIRAATRFHGKHKGDSKVFYTSSYEASGRENQAVAISHESEIPDSYKGVRATELAPSQEMLDKYHGAKDTKEKHAEYAQQYLALLRSRELTPALITDKYENGTIFVCYDYEAGDDSVCHRHILSELLAATGHAEVQPISTKMPHAMAEMRAQVRVLRALGMWDAAVVAKKKRFYTASYGDAGKNPKAVAVSFKSHIPKTYKGTVASNLAPSKAMLDKYHAKTDDRCHSEYAAEYLSLLLKERNLTPAQIADTYENGTIFLCFDYDDDDNFPDDAICHRAILGELLEAAEVATVTAL